MLATKRCFGIVKTPSDEGVFFTCLDTLNQLISW